MEQLNISEFSNILNFQSVSEKFILKLLYKFLKIDKLEKEYAEIGDKQGLEFVSEALKVLNIKYEIDKSDLAKIPEKGAFITVSNHPFGGIDGLILIDIIAKQRPDFKVLANFILSQFRPIENFFIPVNPFENLKKVKSNFKGVKDAYNQVFDGHPLGVFPAGEVSTYQAEYGKISDRQWQSQTIKFIKNSKVPVVPIYFHGTNSLAFHLLGSFHPLLRTMQLPSEILNKKDKTFKIRIGKPIKPEDIAKFEKTEQLSRFLRAKTYALGSSFKVKHFFQQIAPAPKKQDEVVAATPVSTLEMEINYLSEKYLLFRYSDYVAIFSPAYEMPALMNEIGRLREITFRQVGEGTNKKIDLDEYDIYYHHLIVWDTANKKIVGSYRIGKGKDILAQYGKKGFYISSLFKIKKDLNPILKQSLEMGRSFITADYQRKPLSLFLLWKGIFAVLMKNIEYRYLIGPVSISNNFSNVSKSVIVNFIQKNYFDEGLAKWISPRKKFKLAKDKNIDIQALSEEFKMNFNKLDDFINDIQPSLKTPVLLKKYLALNAKIIGFNTDPEFNDCLDGLLILDILNLPDDKVKSLAKELDNDLMFSRFPNLKNDETI